MSNKINRDLAIRRMQEIYDFALATKADASLFEEFVPRYENIERIINSFESAHEKIIGRIVDENELNNEDAIRRGFDNKGYTIRKIYSELNTNQLGARNNNNSSSTNAKLPKINLPLFDGNYKTWPSFIALFNSMVYNNQSLSKTEKFQYLITSLSDEPRSLLARFPLAENNFDSAYQTLVNRYQDKRKLVFMYWEEIVNAKLTSESNLALRKLLDTFHDNLLILENLELPVEDWDFVLFHLLLTKLDRNTRERFELEQTSVEIPSFKTLVAFVEVQCKALSRVDEQKNKNTSFYKKTSWSKPSSSSRPTSNSLSFVVNTEKSVSQKCIFCSSFHPLYKCPTFLEKSPLDRYNLTRSNHVCLNCLSSEHFIQNCPSKHNCRTCGSRHHSLLHYKDKQQNPDLSRSNPSVNFNNTPSTSNTPNSIVPEHSDEAEVVANTVSCKSTVLLSTTLVEILDSSGKYQCVRALIDQGSQANFITENCLRKLGLSRSRLTIPISGVNQMSSIVSKGVTTSNIKPKDCSSPIINFEAIVVPSICTKLPSFDISHKNWDHLSNLKLADPDFNKAHSIDVLIGAEIYPFIMQEGRIVKPIGQPSALKTIFGWVLIGRVDREELSSLNTFCTTVDSSLDTIVKQFWEVEEIPHNHTCSSEEIQCEEIFIAHHHRTSSGRYIVPLPFKGSEPILGDSYSGALRRFRSLERRFDNNPELEFSYKSFMQDYLDSQHMSIASSPQDLSRVYYIPHHCIFKPDSLTTKMRVVFDASAKTTSNLSLNDSLLVGRKLHKDIVTILLLFRLHAIAFTADIKQMYRQILVDDNHRDYQRILWRFSKKDPIEEYRLNTVTYGVSSAPFLAIRTLHQLAMDERSNYPLAAESILTDMYVDDLVTGSTSVDNALELKRQIIGLLGTGGFELRKWASNHLSLLSSSDIDKQNSFSFDSDSFVKILGLQWQPSCDTFSYIVTPFAGPCTKRTILSDLARVFDPLGFLTPVTLISKLLIQKLWTLGLGWDDPPPPEILNRWEIYKSQIPLLSSLRLNRRITVDSYKFCSLHGFADASESAYAAVVYLRFVDSSEMVSVNLVSSKCRVAPLKKISLPRLELCAAVLLSELIHYLLDIFSNKLSISKIYCYSDSSIALTWIRSPPYKWKTFVANRVSRLQEKTSPDCWNHVQSSDNPADCATRGLFPGELINLLLWWNGPSWLSSSPESWPITFMGESNLDLSTEIAVDERKSMFSFLIIDYFDELIRKYSSLSAIIRIVAYCRKFIQNCKSPSSKRFTPFSCLELNEALLALVRHVQHIAFREDIHRLQTKQFCSKPLRKLNVFLDESGVLRVGGRLSNSSLPFKTKHPALLPRDHRLTSLIIEDTHKKYLHPGLQSLQFLISQNFWILSAKRAIKKVLSTCIKCFRVNPTSVTPFMADLPSSRLSQIKPFSRVGIDYGGPFSITLGKHRGAKSYKAYICLFVCFATKAIHLELVSDLSSEAFLAALRRFISRRGRCSHIHSDRGTNLVGGYRKIVECMELAAGQEAIEWHFNPPSAPHFGGLWEAGIKSVKHHLTRVVGEQILTYEEFYTILVQIEAVLNSRPLYPLSSDPNDLSALTPGHFLTLEPLTAPPTTDLTDLPMNRLTRWQLLQRIHFDFWKRWTNEYLHTLHQRSKWSQNRDNIKIDTLVLIRDEQLPPLRWRLGRIVQVHPGKDGIVRVVTVRTATGLLCRPVIKLCPLPQDEK